jgi:hypothetical protein
MTKTELVAMSDEELLRQIINCAKTAGNNRLNKKLSLIQQEEHTIRNFEHELLRRLEAGADCKRRLEELEQLNHTDQPHN